MIQNPIKQTGIEQVCQYLPDMMAEMFPLQNFLLVDPQKLGQGTVKCSYTPVSFCSWPLSGTRCWFRWISYDKMQPYFCLHNCKCYRSFLKVLEKEFAWSSCFSDHVIWIVSLWVVLPLATILSLNRQEIFSSSWIDRRRVLWADRVSEWKKLRIANSNNQFPAFQEPHALLHNKI